MVWCRVLQACTKIHMQQGYFRNWLRYVGNYTEGSIRSILSTCQRVERYEGDLDRHFENDGMEALLGWLEYSTTDERIGAQQRHNVPIRGNVRSGTATLKSHTKLYWEFREYGSAGAERAEMPPPGFRRIRPRRRRSSQSGARHYAGDQAEETHTTSHVGVQWPRADDERVSAVRDRIQPLVRELMWTLLVECPNLLTAEDKRGLQDEAYCWQLGLTISNLPLLRRTGSGTEVNGYNRYWRDPYGDFYVCSQWWKLHHHQNARSLLTFIKDVAERNTGHPEADGLRRHEQAFRDYLAGRNHRPFVSKR